MKPMKTISLLLSGAAVLATSATMVMAQGAYPPLTPLGEPPIPSDNQQTDAKVELGKILFWDPRLGGDASTACVTCHEPDQGWAFGDSLSRGYPGTVHWRNSQSVINSAYLGQLFWLALQNRLKNKRLALPKVRLPVTAKMT